MGDSTPVDEEKDDKLTTTEVLLAMLFVEIMACGFFISELLLIN